ncbi:endonuclease/exonuclease/phosphatase family protein [Mobiluncus mulieris]|uniref:endonuclease/exonuclease/phosphatase family protein n=1 Tax=Mobiluncus mulieris TaxID=2052 RepID=UPI000D96C340|nr:endonuclease/exonuclease/phosphatase family protein [Mobiluncus mulieris]SPX70653.1 Uncharacterized protein conserved in bacteria [Mobiluncus mulieris]
MTNPKSNPGNRKKLPAALRMKLRRFPLPEQVTPTPLASTDYLRIVTFNLHHGKPPSGWPDADLGGLVAPAKQHSTPRQWWAHFLASMFGPSTASARAVNAAGALEDTAAVLRELRPDIICLQEVDKGQRRSGYLPEAEFLANAIGMPYWRMTAAFAGAMSGLRRRPVHTNITRENGYGIAMLSRWPVKSWHVKRLGRARWSLQWGSGFWRGFSKGFLTGLKSLPAAMPGVRLIPGEMRVLQAALILTPFGTIAVGNTHLDTHRGTAQSQLRRAWRSVLELSRHSGVLTGDFNLYADDAAAALGLLDQTMRPSWHGATQSFPVKVPQKTFNQLLAAGWVPVAAPRALRLPVSNHLAVIYDLKPRPVTH